MTDTTDKVLLYDGVCALCNRAVHFVLQHDTRGTIRFAPLTGAFASAVMQRHPELQDVDSIVLVTGAGTARECVAVRSDAALELADYLGGAWRALRTFRFVPRPARDAVYNAVARNRYKTFGRLDACPVPPAGVRHRFID